MAYKKAYEYDANITLEDVDDPNECFGQNNIPTGSATQNYAEKFNVLKLKKNYEKYMSTLIEPTEVKAKPKVPFKYTAHYAPVLFPGKHEISCEITQDLPEVFCKALLPLSSPETTQRYLIQQLTTIRGLPPTGISIHERNTYIMDLEVLQSASEKAQQSTLYSTPTPTPTPTFITLKALVDMDELLPFLAERLYDHQSGIAISSIDYLSEENLDYSDTEQLDELQPDENTIYKMHLKWMDLKLPVKVDVRVDYNIKPTTKEGQKMQKYWPILQKMHILPRFVIVLIKEKHLRKAYTFNVKFVESNDASELSQEMFNYFLMGRFWYTRKSQKENLKYIIMSYQTQSIVAYIPRNTERFLMDVRIALGFIELLPRFKPFITNKHVPIDMEDADELAKEESEDEIIDDNEDECEEECEEECDGDGEAGCEGENDDENDEENEEEIEEENEEENEEETAYVYDSIIR